ncbi:MAG: cobalt transporter subunit CbtA [Gammaproteobacteria bacterium]|jgi:cobalt transporter subunit CbtA
MFKSIVLSACFAGLCAGIVLTLVQQPTVAPILLAAERYESAAPATDESAAQSASQNGGAHGHEASAHAHAGAAHEHGDAWAPENGLERTFWTLLTNVSAAIGFALLLCAVYALLPRITLLGGLLWGLAGFVVFFANPSIGLHPEIPGTLSADLYDRQLWWLFAALCSAAAVALIAWRRVHWIWGVAAVLLVLPHVVGAPQPQVHGGLAPQELSQQFIWATTFVNAVFWLALGVFSALMFRRFALAPSVAI